MGVLGPGQDSIQVSLPILEHQEKENQMNRIQTPSLLLEQHSKIILRGRQGLRLCQLPLGKGPQLCPWLIWISLLLTFPSARRKAQGEWQAILSYPGGISASGS